MTRIVLAVLLALVPQDRAHYEQAAAQFQRLAGADDYNQRILAVRDLGSATYADRDDDTVRALTRMLAMELGRRDASGLVLDAVENALKRVTEPGAVDDLIQAASRRGQPEELRFHLVRSLGGIRSDAVLAALQALCDERSVVIQVAAADALGGQANPAAAPKLVAMADQGVTWEIRVAAIRSLGAVNSDDAVAPLIEILRREYSAMRANEAYNGRIMDEAVKALKAITEIDYDGYAPQVWEQRWAAHQRGEEPGADDGGGTVAVPTEFYGIPTRSTRIVFILDTSGSMSLAATEPRPAAPPANTAGVGEPQIDRADAAPYAHAREIYDEWSARSITTRIESLQKEILKTIFRLDRGVFFALLFFSDQPRAWRPEMVQATWENKAQAMDQVLRQSPNGQTNYWDSLTAGFQYVDQRGRLVRQDRAEISEVVNGADTFFMLSDGEPNAGTIFDKVQIRAELRRVNSIRNVVIHTIALGDDTGDPMTNPDPDYLEGIARDNGGIFRHVTGRP